MFSSMSKVVVIVPNWNGADSLAVCLDSLMAQSHKAHVIVVDNGSKDASLELLQKYPDVEVIRHSQNRGYAGGVNPGFRRAIELGATYAAAFNNDAVADKYWLEKLVDYLESNARFGIAACKLLTSDGKRLDSTGDYYTAWGLPYPRGRGESDINKYDDQTEIFAASGGASLYRVAMLEQIGLFDEDFFAYYEDVDLSFRAQLAGWKVAFVPTALAYHEISATSNKIKGFTTYQTLKNLPLLLFKNVPRRYLFRVSRRYILAHLLFFTRAVSRGQGWIALKGDAKGTWLVFTGLGKRRKIQRSRKVTDAYIWELFVNDLPPNARALRALRNRWWRLSGKKA
jgi:GT2 family glycosyltransferase